MAVITRYIVVRHGVELDQVFEDKKLAEAYDQMLDAAENLAAFIRQADLGVDIDTATIEAVSVHLAKNAPEVNRILKGVKPIRPAAAQASKSDKPAEKAAEGERADEKKSASRKPGPRTSEK